MNREQRREAERQGEPSLTAEQLAAAEKQFEKLKESLRGNSLQGVFEGLEAHQKNGGPESLPQATILYALNIFFGFLKRNELVRLGPKTDAYVALALQAIPSGAAQALEKVQDRRIIVPGR